MVFKQETSQTALIGCTDQQLACFIRLVLCFPRLDATQTTLISLFPNFHSTPEYLIISLAQSPNVLPLNHVISPILLGRDPPQSVRCPGELPHLTSGVGCPLAPGAEDHLEQPWGYLRWGLPL